MITIFTLAFFVAMAAIVVYWSEICSGIFEQRNLFLFTVCKLLNVIQELWYCPSFKSSNENYTLVLQCLQPEVFVGLQSRSCACGYALRRDCLDVHMLVWTINCFDDCKNIVKI